MKYTEKIHNIVTGKIETIEKEYTKTELAEITAIQESLQKQQTEAATRAAARQAILDRLGLTEEEARLLLGGN